MENLSRTLNLVGILLNFLAGIMLAPEAIGIERIRKLEYKTQLASKSILGKIENAYGFLDRVSQVLKIDPFNPRVVVLSMFIYIPGTLLILSNITLISSWIQHLLLCLLNPIYGAQHC